MIDHVNLPVSDLEKSRNFYRQALAPMGFSDISKKPEMVLFGIGDEPQLSLTKAKSSLAPVHLAFRAMNRAHVRKFHEAATRAGGTDNGKPELCPEYHPHYYGGFVLDPDGHNIEAVCHDPE